GVPVIEPRAAQRAVVGAEAEAADQVQHRARGGAQAGDVAGVGRDLRFPQGHVQHARLPTSLQVLSAEEPGKSRQPVQAAGRGRNWDGRRGFLLVEDRVCPKNDDGRCQVLTWMAARRANVVLPWLLSADASGASPMSKAHSWRLDLVAVTLLVLGLLVAVCVF